MSASLSERSEQWTLSDRRRRSSASDDDRGGIHGAMREQLKSRLPVSRRDFCDHVSASQPSSARRVRHCVAAAGYGCGSCPYQVECDLTSNDGTHPMSEVG